MSRPLLRSGTARQLLHHKKNDVTQMRMLKINKKAKCHLRSGCKDLLNKVLSVDGLHIMKRSHLRQSAGKPGIVAITRAVQICIIGEAVIAESQRRRNFPLACLSGKAMRR